MRRLFLLSLMLVVLVLSACAQKEKLTPVIEGSPAPAFSLKDLEGREVNLADLQGKVVLLNFWATWCPPCREEIPSMMRLNQAMAGRPFQMLAVSQDEGGREAVAAFFRKSGTTLPTLLDPGQAVGKRYGLTGVPETFIIDKKGVILKKVVGAMDWSAPNVVSFLAEAAASQ